MERTYGYQATPYVCLLRALDTLPSPDTAPWLPCLCDLCSGPVVQLDTWPLCPTQMLCICAGISASAFVLALSLPR